MNHDISRSKSLERLRPVALSVLGHRYYYQLHPGYLPGGRYRGVLTVSVVAIYILVVACFGSLLQAQGNLGITLLATGLVAVLFQPLCMRLQQVVKRLMYGDRDEPYHVISRLGSRLQDSRDPIYRVRPIYRARQGDEWTIAASYGSLQDEP